MRTLVIGGAGCGKSEWAETISLQGTGPHYYVATLVPHDRECLSRIARHQQTRAAKGFTTLERPTDLAGLHLPERGSVLLECLGNLVANELFNPDGAGGQTVVAIEQGIARLEQNCSHLVVVSNDIFGDGIHYTDGTHRYIEVLAAFNQLLARRFDRVVEVVCGIPLVLKGNLPSAGIRSAMKNRPLSRDQLRGDLS